MFSETKPEKWVLWANEKVVENFVAIELKSGNFPVRKIILRTGSDSLVSFVFKTINFGWEHTDKRNFSTRYDPVDNFPDWKLAFRLLGNTPVFYFNSFIILFVIFYNVGALKSKWVRAAAGNFILLS